MDKAFRLLAINERLVKGERINKKDLAKEFSVTEKSIQRDIDGLRDYLAENHLFENEVAIKYDKVKNNYYLVRQEREWLTNEEVLAICKILLESRAFNKSELDGILLKLLMQVTPSEKSQVEKIIKNEQFNYIPLQHNKELLSKIWEISTLISDKEVTHVSYKRQDGTEREYDIKPVAIMFSEYYFYLIAYMADDSKRFPTTFRIDRIIGYKSTDKKFDIPYKDKFSDGEFRKRVQFMYGGPLKRVEFTYSGNSIEAVLDRLPTAQILSKNDGIYTIKAEAFGNGIDMWLKSQGERVEVVGD